MVPANPSPTSVLTRGLAAGDEAAFRQFHEEYFDRLLRYHLILARGDEHAARDALQETLTRVARKGRHLKPKRPSGAGSSWSREAPPWMEDAVGNGIGLH